MTAKRLLAFCIVLCLCLVLAVTSFAATDYQHTIAPDTFVFMYHGAAADTMYYLHSSDPEESGDDTIHFSRIWTDFDAHGFRISAMDLYDFMNPEMYDLKSINLEWSFSIDAQYYQMTNGCILGTGISLDGHPGATKWADSGYGMTVAEGYYQVFDNDWNLLDRNAFSKDWISIIVRRGSSVSSYTVDQFANYVKNLSPSSWHTSTWSVCYTLPVDVFRFDTYPRWFDFHFPQAVTVRVPSEIDDPDTPYIYATAGSVDLNVTYTDSTGSAIDNTGNQVSGAISDMGDQVSGAISDMGDKLANGDAEFQESADAVGESNASLDAAVQSLQDIVGSHDDVLGAFMGLQVNTDHIAGGFLRELWSKLYYTVAGIPIWSVYIFLVIPLVLGFAFFILKA